MRQEFLGDQELVIGPRPLDRSATLRLHQRLVAREKLFDLHRIVGKRLGRRIDGGQSAADDGDGQPHLHVRNRIVLGRAGQLQRHQEIRCGSHAVRKTVRQIEHGWAAGAGRQRHMIEAEGERILDVERPAETHAAVERVVRAPLEQEPNHLEEILVPPNGDAVLRHAAEARHHAVIERFGQRCDVPDGREGNALAGDRHAR